MSGRLFIVNPAAGKGRGLRTGKALEGHLARDKVVGDVVYTTARGEALRLTRESVAETIIAVGGDGTVHEIVNGIGTSNRTLGIVPTGSGNDSIKSLGIPSTVEPALDCIIQGHARRVDTGSITWSGPGGGGKALFLNGAGAGFDAAVAQRAGTIGFLRGTLLYLAAVLLTLREFRAPTVRIAADGTMDPGVRRLLVAIGNGACSGGGFYLTPAARMDDGVLDVCAIRAVSASGILRLIPKVLRARHIGEPGIDTTTARNITVQADPPIPLHADGEILSPGASRIEIRVQTRSLRVLVPNDHRI